MTKSIYLESEVEKYLIEQHEKTGVSISKQINNLIRANMNSKPTEPTKRVNKKLERLRQSVKPEGKRVNLSDYDI